MGTDKELFHALLNPNDLSVKPVLSFIAWALEHNWLKPKSNAFLSNIPRSSESHVNTLKWLQYWSRQDMELQALTDRVCHPLWPPMMEFIEWAIQNDVLKAIPPNKSETAS